MTVTTIAQFPTYEETKVANVKGYYNHEGSTIHFAGIEVFERYQNTRLGLENSISRHLDKALNGIPGRSAARTKLDKINFLLAQDYTIGADGIVYEKNDPRAAEAVAPTVPEETEEDRDNATLMEIDPQVAEQHFPLSQWIEGKKQNPRAIVMVENNEDPRCLLTYAGDAAIASKLLYLRKGDAWFGDQGFDKVEIGKGALPSFRLRLKDHGYEVIAPPN
jgi:hypothetical protein